MANNSGLVPASPPVDPSYKKMIAGWPPELKQLKAEIDDIFGSMNKTGILKLHRIGTLTGKAMADPNKRYGDNPVGKLATAYGLENRKSRNEQFFYDCKSVSEAFSYEFLKKFLGGDGKPPTTLANGNDLTHTHLVVLSRIDGEAARQQYLNRVINESLTTHDLKSLLAANPEAKKNVRKGGRNPMVPRTPEAGIVSLTKIGQRFSNFVDSIDDTVFTPFMDYPVDQTNESILDTLNDCKTNLVNVMGSADFAVKRLEAVIERTHARLEKKKTLAKEQKREERQHRVTADKAIDDLHKAVKQEKAKVEKKPEAKKPEAKKPEVKKPAGKKASK